MGRPDEDLQRPSLFSYGVSAVRLCELLTDEKTGKLSTTKIWMHIANGIMSYVMLHQDVVSWELLSAYGAIVGGSYMAGKFLRLKYSGKPKDDMDIK